MHLSNGQQVLLIIIGVFMYMLGIGPGLVMLISRLFFHREKIEYLDAIPISMIVFVAIPLLFGGIAGIAIVIITNW